MLLLVRHGRTGHNASRRLLGRIDAPLDELGRLQAAAIGASPALARVERVVSSPAQRALDTAACLGRPVEVDPRWVEIDYGVLDGLALDEVPAEVWSAWDDDPEWAPEGGESLGAVGRRVHAACEALWADAAGGDVVVVSHVSPIKAAIGWALGLAPEATPSMFVAVASLHRIGPGRQGPSLHSFNEVHHLP